MNFKLNKYVNAEDPILNWNKLTEIADATGITSEKLTTLYNDKKSLLEASSEKEEIAALEQIVEPMTTSEDEKGISDWLKTTVSKGKETGFDYLKSVKERTEKEKKEGRKAYGLGKEEEKTYNPDSITDTVRKELDEIYKTPEVQKGKKLVEDWFNKARDEIKDSTSKYVKKKDKQGQRLVNTLTGTYPSAVLFVEEFKKIKSEDALPLFSNSTHMSLTNEVYQAFISYLQK